MKPGRVRGFTLVELVVTLAIVGLLASMAMPLTQLVVKRSREHELRASLRSIRDALDHYNDLWRYSCMPAGQGGAPAGTGAPGAPVGGGVSGSIGGSAERSNGAGSVANAGLGGSGGVSASTVTTIGGTGANGEAPPPTPPKMECPTASTGWPKDLQVLVDGVNNIASPQPGAKVYFLRRIPRDPFNLDSSVAAIDSWGKRSSASPADEPQEGDDVYDVYSLSTEKDLTGQPYRDW